ncbi:MAG: DNA polymerase I [Christensenellales bacterium]|jgi:DNA polymerase-1
MSEKLVVIDGYSLLHRAFYALPPLTAGDGTPTGAVYGFLSMLFKVAENARPDYLVVALDRKEPTMRHEMFEGYKAQRPPMPELLRPQVPLLIRVLEDMKIPMRDAAGYEADDILGTYACAAEEKGIEAYLVTGDKDVLQLVSDKVQVWLTRKGISEIDVYDPQKLTEVYGLTPDKMIDLKALMGDSSDNIPGIPGVGEKTALKLLHQFGSLEGILENAGNVSGPKLQQRLMQNADLARMSRKLAVIHCEAPVAAEDLEAIRYRPEGGEGVRRRFLELGFKSLLKRLDIMTGGEGAETIPEQAAPGVKTVTIRDEATLNEASASWRKAKRIAVHLEDDRLSVSTGKDAAAYIELQQDLLSAGLTPEAVFNALGPLFEDAGVEKVLYDAKAWMTRLKAFGIDLNGVGFDILIAAYLLDATASRYPMDRLRDVHAGGAGEKDAALLLRMRESMRKKLCDLDMQELFEEMELPLIKVLFDMEQEGFRVDEEALDAIGRELGEAIETLSEEILDLAGHPFNINSPKQLGVVLFEELGLRAIKKTKSGYSTDVDVLEQLSQDHPIVPLIIRYRQVSKLKNTYVDGLKPLISKADGKLHTTFHQEVTTTGRISSSEPNLQNIPVRTELGRPLRKIFCASAEDRILVDADYSQIELRVLAHMSQDERMMWAFSEGLDIHVNTAAQMWGVKLSQVTDQMRTAAKAINFGIVYGISDFGLSRNIGISRKQAGEFIRRYLETYQGVRDFMENIVAEAEKNGYAVTMFGRRRYLPELTAGQYNVRNFGKRVAMNMPIQGTAADIIKMAMIRVHQALEESDLDAKLILQVHDELIVDCHKSARDQAAQIVRESMQQVIRLDVPLVAEVKSGRTWYDAK